MKTTKAKLQENPSKDPQVKTSVCGGCGVTVTDENNSGSTITDFLGHKPEALCLNCLGEE